MVDRNMEIDLHGYHPRDIDSDKLAEIIQQCWEMGEREVCFIHGHGRNRGRPPSFVNTNTGFLGLTVRKIIREGGSLKPRIFRSSLSCGDAGKTTIRLKPNPNPTRTELDYKIASSL